MNNLIELKDGVQTIKMDSFHAMTTATPVELIPDRADGRGNAKFPVLFAKADEVYDYLANTTASRWLKAAISTGNVLIKGTGTNADPFYIKDFVTANFTAMTRNANDCCAVPGDLQLCDRQVILKMICMEKSLTNGQRIVDSLNTTNSTRVLYEIYNQLATESGIPKKSLPKYEDFEQFSFIAQWNLYKRLVILNANLDVERNNNLIPKFSGLNELMEQPDIMHISGSSGVIAAFQQIMCRLQLIGRNATDRAVFITSNVAMSAIISQVTKDKYGKYPEGWTVNTQMPTSENSRNPNGRYYFLGIPILESRELYIDETTLSGDVYLINQNVGLFWAGQDQFTADFVSSELAKATSPFVILDRTKQAAPTCWSEITDLIDMGAVFATDVNGLIVIEDLQTDCDADVYQGYEGLININSLSPYLS